LRSRLLGGIFMSARLPIYADYSRCPERGIPLLAYQYFDSNMIILQDNTTR
jgi:hypothetical protein